MRLGKLSLLAVLCTVLWCVPAGAQSVFKALSGAAAAAAAPKPTDPMGRTSTRGTLMGFMEAAQRGEMDHAVEYRQLTR